MNFFKQLFGEKIKEEISAIVTEKEFIPSRVLPTRFFSPPMSEQHRVHLKADEFTGFIDDKTIFDTTNIGDIVKVFIIKKYSSKGILTGVNFVVK